MLNSRTDIKTYTIRRGESRIQMLIVEMPLGSPPPTAASLIKDKAGKTVGFREVSVNLLPPVTAEEVVRYSIKVKISSYTSSALPLSANAGLFDSDVRVEYDAAGELGCDYVARIKLNIEDGVSTVVAAGGGQGVN